MHIAPKPPVTTFHINLFNRETWQWDTVAYGDSEAQAHREARRIIEAAEADPIAPRVAVIATTVVEYVEADEAAAAHDERDGFTPAAPAWDAPDWDAIGSPQTIRCGKAGVRKTADATHAAWIRTEARRRGLTASVTLTDGSAIVTLRAKAVSAS